MDLPRDIAIAENLELRKSGMLDQPRDYHNPYRADLETYKKSSVCKYLCRNNLRTPKCRGRYLPANFPAASHQVTIIFPFSA